MTHSCCIAHMARFMVSQKRYPCVVAHYVDAPIRTKLGHCAPGNNYATSNNISGLLSSRMNVAPAGTLSQGHYLSQVTQ